MNGVFYTRYGGCLGGHNNLYAPVTYVRGMCVLIIATIISSCGTDNQPVLVHFISIDRVPTKEAQQKETLLFACLLATQRIQQIARGC